MSIQDPGIKWFYADWYPETRVSKAVRMEDGILPRLEGETVQLFTPWGPRYHWQETGEEITEDDREVATLQFLANILSQLRSNMPGKSFNWLLLGADLYGTRINNLPAQVVQTYFTSLENWLREVIPAASFALWSDYDKQAEEYRQQTRARLDELVNAHIRQQARETAQRMPGAGGAEDYLVERLAEAMLIEETFQPIKVSLAPPGKDSQVDLDLPRLYIVPEKLRTPWLK